MTTTGERREDGRDVGGRFVATGKHLEEGRVVWWRLVAEGSASRNTRAFACRLQHPGASNRAPPHRLHDGGAPAAGLGVGLWYLFKRGEAAFLSFRSHRTPTSKRLARSTYPCQRHPSVRASCFRLPVPCPSKHGSPDSGGGSRRGGRRGGADGHQLFAHGRAPAPAAQLGAALSVTTRPEPPAAVVTPPPTPPAATPSPPRLSPVPSPTQAVIHREHDQPLGGLPPSPTPNGLSPSPTPAAGRPFPHMRGMQTSSTTDWSEVVQALYQLQNAWEWPGKVSCGLCRKDDKDQRH